MEISDLVNTIEGLTEEQAVEIVAKAEVLAEAQTEELPRRKGARGLPRASRLPSSRYSKRERANRARTSRATDRPPTDECDDQTGLGY